MTSAMLLAMCLMGAPKAPRAGEPARRPTNARAQVQASSPVKAQGDRTELLRQLNGLYDSLEYDQVTVLAEQVLAREDLSLEQRLEAYRLQGCAKAIVEDPIDAEKPFRMLLRARSDYELPAATPPKILAVFRKVQTEERALANQLSEVERARIIASLKLIGAPPNVGQGGRPLKFRFRVKDPSGAVDAVRVPYRKFGERVFSTLALQRSDEGDWLGAIAGEVTASEKDYRLEYYVETSDARGPLLTLGTQSSPGIIEVSSGFVPKERFVPIPRPLFFTSVGVTAALGIATGALGTALLTTQNAYRSFVAGPGPVEGTAAAARAAQGQSLAEFTNVAWISAASMLVITLIMIPFTNFATE